MGAGRAAHHDATLQAANSYQLFLLTGHFLGCLSQTLFLDRHQTVLAYGSEAFVFIARTRFHGSTKGPRIGLLSGDEIPGESKNRDAQWLLRFDGKALVSGPDGRSSRGRHERQVRVHGHSYD